MRRLSVERITWRTLLPGLSSGDEGAESDDGVHRVIRITGKRRFTVSMPPMLHSRISLPRRCLIAFVYRGTFHDDCHRVLKDRRCRMGSLKSTNRRTSNLHGGCGITRRQAPSRDPLS